MLKIRSNWYQGRGQCAPRYIGLDILRSERIGFFNRLIVMTFGGKKAIRLEGLGEFQFPGMRLAGNLPGDALLKGFHCMLPTLLDYTLEGQYSC